MRKNEAIYENTSIFVCGIGFDIWDNFPYTEEFIKKRKKGVSLMPSENIILGIIFAFWIFLIVVIMKRKK